VGRLSSDPRSRSGAAGTFGAATGTTGAKVDAAVQFEAVHVKIDFDGLGLFQEIGVDDKLISVHVEGFVGIGRLIQSHGQAGTASAAFVEENPDRLDLFPFEIFGDLLDCRLRDFKHGTLLELKIGPESISDRGRYWFQMVNLTMCIDFVNPISGGYSNARNEAREPPDIHTWLSIRTQATHRPACSKFYLSPALINQYLLQTTLSS
jgi:hypothetical protein